MLYFNQVALRWRIEKEVVSGKGQFICGNKYCNSQENLRSWEVNFAYVEHGEKKNALIKLSTSYRQMILAFFLHKLLILNYFQIWQGCVQNVRTN